MACYDRIENESITELKRTFSELEEIWDDLGVLEDEKTTRHRNFAKLVTDLLKKVVNGEKTLRSNTTKLIEDNLLLIKQLAKDLEISEPIIRKNSTILELDGAVKKQLEKLNKIKNERLSQYRYLQEKDEGICEILCETPHYIPKDKFPSLSDLSAIDDHIKAMEIQKTERENTLKKLKYDIMNFLELLEHPPNDSFTRELVCSDVDDITLGTAFLQQLRTVHSELEFRKNEMEVKSIDLRDKINSLWMLLEVSTDEREAFLATVPKHTKTSIAKLEEELEHLNDLKKTNISIFIEKLHVELQQWWAKCYVSKEDMDEFIATSGVEDCASETVMTALETEIMKWKKYYNQNEDILVLLDQFITIFKQMIELQDRAKDPSRLFKTRGGVLLQEEKERKRVKAELPRIQEKLLKTVLEKEIKFYVEGVLIEDYIESLWVKNEQKREEGKPKKSKPNNVENKKEVPPSQVTLKRGRELENDRITKRVRHGTTFVAFNRMQSPTKAQQNTVKVPSTLPRPSRPLVESNHLVPSSSSWDYNSLSTASSLQTTVSYDKFEAELKSSNEYLNSTTCPQSSNDGQHSFF